MEATRCAREGKTTLVDTLGVARSNLVEQVRRMPTGRRAYRKADDAWLLPLIRAIVDERPILRLSSVGALLSLQVAALGKPPAISACTGSSSRTDCCWRAIRERGDSETTTAWSGRCGRTCAGVRMCVRGAVLEWRHGAGGLRARDL